MKNRSFKNSAAEEIQDAITTGKFRKVRCAGAVFKVPGDEKDRDLTVPAFTTFQMLGVMKIVETVGQDFELTYKLASFIFEKLIGYHSVEPGSIPSDNLYADWLREFRVREGMIASPMSAVA